MSDRPIYIDIDGTLTDQPVQPWGNALASRLARVRELVAEGRQVVIWSGGGTVYAKAFCKQYGLEGVTAIGKPEAIVDDNPLLRPTGRMSIIAPDEYFKEDA